MAESKHKKRGKPCYEMMADKTQFTVRATLPEAEHFIDIFSDWYGSRRKKFQLVVTDAKCDEPVAHLRFNDDGTMHSIILRPDWDGAVKRDNHAGQDEWEIARDGKWPEPKKPKKPKKRKLKTLAEITAAVGAAFRSFGGGRGSDTNPIAAALQDKPLQFAAGVDIRSVVEAVRRLSR